MNCRRRGLWFNAHCCVLALAWAGTATAQVDQGSSTPRSRGLAFVPEQATVVVEVSAGRELLERAGPPGRAALGKLAFWLGVEEDLLGRILLDQPVTAALLPATGEHPSLLLAFAGGEEGPPRLFQSLARGEEAIRDAGTLAGVALRGVSMNRKFYLVLSKKHPLSALNKTFVDFVMSSACV